MTTEDAALQQAIRDCIVSSFKDTDAEVLKQPGQGADSAEVRYLRLIRNRALCAI